jgi:protein-S-isoprenylcysteine O-methyltransferase Ste14
MTTKFIGGAVVILGVIIALHPNTDEDSKMAVLFIVVGALIFFAGLWRKQ